MNPFSNFPLKGKAISVVLLVVTIFFLYQWWKDEHKTMQPGTGEYIYFHSLDTIDESKWDDSTPTVIGHYWYIDSNKVWHEKNCGDTACWIHKHDKTERTDSTDYTK